MAAGDMLAHGLQNKESLATATDVTAQVGLRERNKAQLHQAGNGDFLVAAIPGVFSLSIHRPKT